MVDRIFLAKILLQLRSKYSHRNKELLWKPGNLRNKEKPEILYRRKSEGSVRGTQTESWAQVDPSGEKRENINLIN